MFGPFVRANSSSMNRGRCEPVLASVCAMKRAAC